MGGFICVTTIFKKVNVLNEEAANELQLRDNQYVNKRYSTSRLVGTQEQ